MTIGIGAVSEEGAILIVDSNRTIHKSDGSIADVVVDDKLLMSEPGTNRDLRLGVVFSGPSPAVMWPVPLPEDDCDFGRACSNVWKALTHGRWASFVAAEDRVAFHEVLVAGGVVGAPVALMRMGSDIPPREADGRYVFGIGYASGVWEPRKHPATMPEAIAVGLELFTAQMRERISHASRLGVPAQVAWPANVAWISPDRIDTFTLSEPHFQCAW